MQLFSKIFLKNHYLLTFWLCLLTSTLIFLPFVLLDQGYFLYYGDFNVQQIPFYQHAHEMVRTGSFGWDWNTDLGTNFIGSYSFYLLGSPFFWLTLPFPTAWVPFLMAPLYVLKFSCAGVAAFAFLKRFTKNSHFAILGGLLYAFCGFNLFNVFFNHFHEPMILFPLMLVALEETIFNGRKGILAILIGISTFVNYYFLTGQALFLLLYFIVRVLSGSYPKITLKLMVQLIFESFLGLFLAAALLWPSILMILQNNRLSQNLTGMDLLFYGDEQRYGLILQSLFFPPDIPARPNFFPNSNAKWSSVSLYLPLFTTTGVITFFKYAKKHWLKPLLLVCFVFAWIPYLNSLFSGLNSSYYARWFYMPVLMMVLMTVLSLEKSTWNQRTGVVTTGICVGAFALIGVLPSLENNETVWFSIPPYPDYFWQYVIIAVVSIVLLLILFTFPRFGKRFFTITVSMVMVISVLSSYSHISAGREQQSSDNYQGIVTDGIAADDFDLKDEQFFRIDTYSAPDNVGMMWGLPTINAFHSIVPGSTMDFYNEIGVGRSVASRPELDHLALRALTSTRYLMVHSSGTLPDTWGFTSIGVQNNYTVYENQNFIPMGFTYEQYITETDYNTLDQSTGDQTLLTALWLSDEDAANYGHLLTRFSPETAPILDESTYTALCAQYAQTAATGFEETSYGFTSTITLDRENLVFYSVPYEDGWTATVNGEPVDVIQANIGFMAVVAPAGDNEIVFTYQTPGFTVGVIVSAIAILILLGYLWLVRREKRQRLHRNEVLSLTNRAGHDYLRKTTDQILKKAHKK